MKLPLRHAESVDADRATGGAKIRFGAKSQKSGGW